MATFAACDMLAHKSIALNPRFGSSAMTWSAAVSPPKSARKGGGIPPRAFITLAASVLLSLSLFGKAMAENAKLPFDVENATCGEFVASFQSSERQSSERKLAAFVFTWVAGYRAGLASLATLDNGLRTVGNLELEKAEFAVFAYCEGKPTVKVVDAATTVFEMFVNVQSDKTISFAPLHK